MKKPKCEYCKVKDCKKSYGIIGYSRYCSNECRIKGQHVFGLKK